MTRKLSIRRLESSRQINGRLTSMNSGGRFPQKWLFSIWKWFINIFFVMILMPIVYFGVLLEILILCSWVWWVYNKRMLIKIDQYHMPCKTTISQISRANWTDPIQRKHFIDLCLQEANKGFRSGGGLMSRHGYNFKYPKAKQFHFKPLANVEELDALFGGVLAIGSKNWSFGRVIASRAEESSTHSTSMSSETLISLKEDENLPRNTNDEVEGSKKK
ncbi:hypothetical protein AAG906_037335 [Vitis piasezkii]